ncbi:hypothetical protein ACFVHB_20020 [Kitasatospora sp. NPDC127111]|uniref:hypothetical protein n=1 Tax=Kitasatospora sp. NPDC127111 TaxID=3345363 RepID=UPI00364163D5
MLFSATDLRTYTRRAVTDAEYALIHEMTDDAIRGEVGARLTEPPQPGIKSVALAVAARGLTNPGGLRSATAGAVSESYTDALTGIVLTEQELRRIRRAVGRSGGAGMLNIGPCDAEPSAGIRSTAW